MWELLGRLPRPHWPALLRGDRDWGTLAKLARAEQEGIRYLFKLRLTPGVKKTVERLMRGAAWTAAGQGCEGAETRLRLAGWNRARRAIVLRRRVQADLAVVDPRDPEQLNLTIATLADDTLVYEYAVLVTSLTHEILSIAQLYRNRADSEVFFEDWKLHEGWGQLTPQWDEEGSSRGLTLSLLLDHALLLHPQQQARLENRRPACTVGSLQQHARMEAPIEVIRGVVDAENPHQRLEEILTAAKRLFPLRDSTKHMNGRDLGCVDVHLSLILCEKISVL